jgi:hypothetical protein
VLLYGYWADEHHRHLVAEHRDDAGTRSLVRHVRKLDAGDYLQQLASEMGRAAAAADA